MKFDKLSGQQSIRVSEDAFQDVVDAFNKPFQNYEQDALTNSKVATIAIAVGLNNDRQLSSSPPTRPFKLDSLDQNRVLRTLIENKHPEESPDSLQTLLGEYMEGGVRTLHESIENGYIGYEDYFEKHPSAPFPE